MRMSYCPEVARSRVFENLRIDWVRVGEALIDAVNAEAKLRGANRVAVVASGTLARTTDVIVGLEASLGERHAGRFDRLVEHTPRQTVIELADWLRHADADLVVTVGGGTPIDTVKVALACLAHDITTADDLEIYAIRVGPDGARINPPIGTPPVLQVAAPTTLSGAEFHDLAGCTDTATSRKQLFEGRETGARSVILDPAITTHTPMDLWLSTGVRAIDHAVEALCSPAPEPFVDGPSLHGIALLATALPATLAAPDDLEARLDCQLAVWSACVGLNRVPLGASHGLGHQLGAVAGMSHGHTSCVMMPHVMAFNEPVTAPAQARIAAALGTPGRPAHEAMTEFIESLGMPTRLRDAGVAREHLPVVAELSINHPWVAGNVRPFESLEQLTDLLEAAY